MRGNASDHPPGGRQPTTLRLARLVVDHRLLFASLLAAATLFFLYPVLNAATGGALPGPRLRIGADARDLLPDHPFVHAQDKYAGSFGNSSRVAICLTVSEGSIFTPETLAKIKRVMNSLDGWGFDPHLPEREQLFSELDEEGVLDLAGIRRELDRRYPPYPVDHDQVLSLVHVKTRLLKRDASDRMTSVPLVDELPTSPEEAEALRVRIQHNAPEIFGRLVSHDERAALITASFVTDRLSTPEIHRAVFDHIQQLVEREQDDRHQIHVTGAPLVTGWVLAHAWEIGASVGASTLLVFALLWLYFRRLHGVLIPLVAATVTVIWGCGFTGWMGIPLDPLVLVVPMLITARAVSHTVQMAERFFEDYERLHALLRDSERARREAAVSAMSELMVPGSLGIITDACGLLVILVTTIPQMRNLGLFGAFWVLSILFTVELLHPILISYLPPPRTPAHYTPGWMIHFTSALGRAATHPAGRWWITGTTLVIFASAAWIAIFHSTIGSARPGISIFWPDHPFNVAMEEFGTRFGGVDTLVIYAEGDRNDSAGNSEALRQMEDLERLLQREAGARTALSLVPVVRRMGQMFGSGDPKKAVINDDASVWVMFVRLNSARGALDSLVSRDGRVSATTLIFKDHRGETIETAVRTAEAFIAAHPTGEISLRLAKHHAEAPARIDDPEHWKDLLYYTLGPLLPERAHTLHVKQRGASGYEPLHVMRVSDEGLPVWIAEFRDAARERYQREQEQLSQGRRFTWPADLANWEAGDVSEWWDGESAGVRAVVVNTSQLLVQDLHSREDPSPVYQPTKSWTRGVELVLAGGVMGLLAAINEEVERSHVANISLIFFVIFVLHSVTYRSLTSGAIILLQIMTATLVSLAVMALRGEGLNVNTLPVQSVGVGIGVDYAIYIVDRIRQETRRVGDVDQAIRIAIRTTGTAVTFTATTIMGGIIFWVFSSLRFQAEMAQMLIVLMLFNLIGAITVVPALYSIFRPRVGSASVNAART